ncbi:hypothetical protein QQF64_019944, partial [Cirrhinus molitorella]
VFADTDEMQSVSVMEGDSVTLQTDVTELQKDDELEWRFSGILIATASHNLSGISVWVKNDGPLKDRLQLKKQTGDLKIRNIRNTDSGQWKINIFSTRGSTSKIFYISGVSGTGVKSVPVLVGDSVMLNSTITEIQRYDVIRWRFEHQNTPVAEINRNVGIFNTYDGADLRFRDRLQLNCFTGSLTIRNIETRHSGLYEVDIGSTGSKHTIHKSFNVTVSDGEKSLSLIQGFSVTLQTGLTEIQNDDQMLWMFGDTVLAKIQKAVQTFFTFNSADERFRDRLKLDHQTGSLIITDIRTTDSGPYELKISSSRYTINRRFSVAVSALSPAATAGIVAGVAILVAAAVVVAAVLLHHHRKMSRIERQTENPWFLLKLA